MTEPVLELAFIDFGTLSEIGAIATRISASKGFGDRDFPSDVALIHSEVSEALEGFRRGNQQSGHIPEFTAIEEELADILIRVLNVANRRECRIAEAVKAKLVYNAGRPLLHGGKAL